MKECWRWTNQGTFDYCYYYGAYGADASGGGIRCGNRSAKTSYKEYMKRNNVEGRINDEIMNAKASCPFYFPKKTKAETPEGWYL